MRYAALSLFLAGLAAAAVAAEGSSFFDGKSLNGWEGLTQYWKVQDGAIVGSTFPDGIKFNTFLCSKRTYKDFELSFQVRLKDGKGNSGVQIRSQILDPQKFSAKGPQCDMATGYWGSLYGEQFGGMMQAAPPEKVKQAVKPADFNDYHVRCVGRHVTISINGTTLVDGDFAKMPPEGIIAWQLHQGVPMEVTFRNIQFKELK
jgi:hypothetical protein